MFFLRNPAIHEKSGLRKQRGEKNRNSAPGGGFETSLSLLGLTMKKRVRIFLRTTMNASLHAAGPLPLKKEKRPLKLKVSPPGKLAAVNLGTTAANFRGQMPGGLEY